MFGYKIEIIIIAVICLFVLLLYVTEAVLVTVCIINKMRSRRLVKNILLTKPAIVLHVITTVGIICFLYGYFIEPYRIEVNTFSIQTDKLSRISFRIVQISDLHCDRKKRNEEAVVELVNQLKPDVIVFTGDAVNTPVVLDYFKKTMSRLKASIAKLAVYGNWETDHWPGLDYYSQTGFKLLNEQIVELEKDGEVITVTGLSFDKPGAAAGLLQKHTDDYYNIFLFHSPDLIEDIGDFNVDLYLCGHTHGGQIALPFYGALITMSKFGKKYESGMYEVNDVILYVNRGIGLDPFPAPQMRFLCRPEIAVFDIGPNE